MIPSQNARALFNNQYAQAMVEGDPRFQMKQTDRGGISRGAGSFTQGSIQGAQKLAEGVADAYKQRTAMNQYNANQAFQVQQSNDLQAQALAALRQQQQLQEAAMRQQNKNMKTDFVTSLLGGLLG